MAELGKDLEYVRGGAIHAVGTSLVIKTGGWRVTRPYFEDQVPACQNACPAGNDIEAWIKLIQRNRYQDAYWHLKREEPFPAILGRVCFKFCEGICNRSQLDKTVSIKSLERFIGDIGDPTSPHPSLPDYNGTSLAVVGSGPAGMSAAYYARLLGQKVTIFEALPEPGGILRIGIPAYRLPREILAREFEGLKKMGIEVKTNTEVGKDTTLEQLQAQFDYVFVATGAHKSRPIGVEGEELSPHIMSGLAMLKKVALGQKLDLGKKVAVIGGGNTAIDAARAALRLGCEVIVVYRRTRNEMPAHEEEVEESRQEGVEFRFLAAPEKIELNNDQSIKKFVCCEMELGEVDQSGRRSPKKIEGKTFNLKVDSIVSAVGEEPLFGYLDASVVTGAGAVRVGADLSAQVKKEGKVKVFAGGDILDTPRTVIHAIGEGKKAAIGIDCLRKGINFTELLPRITLGDGGPLSFALYMGWKTLNENPFDNKTVVTPEKIKYDYIEKAPQMEVRIRPPRERKTDFSPYVETYDKEAALKEAERCMHCGRCLECDNCVLFCPDASVLAQKGGGFRYAFEYDYCKGCVVCAEECPCGVILSKREE